MFSKQGKKLCIKYKSVLYKLCKSKERAQNIQNKSVFYKR